MAASIIHKVLFKNNELKYFDKAQTTINGVVIDNIEDSNEFDLTDLIKRQICQKTKGVLFNYFIDDDGSIYHILQNFSGRVCKFDTYSNRASTLFPTYCPPTDAKLKPRDFSVDEVLESILVKTKDNQMTFETSSSLRNLIIYILGKTNNEDPSKKLDINNIYLRSMFPEELEDTAKCGKLFSNRLDFMVFKRNVARKLDSTIGYNLFVSVGNNVIYGEGGIK